MKFPLRTPIFTLIFLIHFSSVAQTVIGAPDCGKWTNDSSFSKKSWLLGYMSGLNMAHGLANLQAYTDPLAKLSSAQQIFLWVDNYCKGNPLKSVEDAGWHLFKELQRK